MPLIYQTWGIVAIRATTPLGAKETYDIELEITAFSDNLPQPEELCLLIHVEAEKQSADLKRILEFERERISSSPK